MPNEAAGTNEGGAYPDPSGYYPGESVAGSIEAGSSGVAAALAPEAATAQQDSETAAERAPESKPTIHFPERAWLANLRWVMSVLLIVFFIRTFVGEATIIPTGSMENTILIGDHVFLNKLFYGPRVPFSAWRLPVLRAVKRQQIIAFRYPRDPQMIYVKRVIGLPGESVEIRRNRVFINGAELKESYTLFNSPALRDTWGPITIPPEQYFVMGDNRDNSYDSRFWGPVPAENIVGEPLMVYWSYDATSDAWLGEGFANRARFYASVAAHFFSRTRWSRTGLTF